MKLNDRWEIRQGPMGNDYALIEKKQYFSHKYKEYRTSETPRYYPNMETLAKAVARLEGIDAVVLESVDAVIEHLKAIEASIVSSSRDNPCSP